MEAPYQIGRRKVLKTIGVTSGIGVGFTGQALARTCSLVYSNSNPCDELRCQVNDFSSTVEVKFYFDNDDVGANAIYGIGPCSSDWNEVWLDPHDQFSDTLTAGSEWFIGVEGCLDSMEVEECHDDIEPNLGVK